METTPRRDRTALNLGLAELGTIIPELDEADRIQLTGILANALYDLVGDNGLVWIIDKKRIFRARLTIEALEYDFAEPLDTAAEKSYNGSDARECVNG